MVNEEFDLATIRFTTIRHTSFQTKEVQMLSEQCPTAGKQTDNNYSKQQQQQHPQQKSINITYN